MEALRQFLKSWFGILLLVLFLAPLALLGLESYFTGGQADNTVISVADQHIDQQTFESEYRQQLEQIQSNVSSPDLINKDNLKQSVVDTIISRAVLQQQAQKLNLVVPDEVISQQLKNETAFLGADGQFSEQSFSQYLRQSGLTKDQLFEQIREQIRLSELASQIGTGAILPTRTADQLISLQQESRDVWLHRFDWQQYQDNIDISDDEIKAAYTKNQKDYNTKSLVDIDYLELTPQDFADKAVVSEEEKQARYQQLAQEIAADSERHVRHILVTGEDAEQQSKQLYAQIEAGADFAELARQHSDDPGSSDKGGDLGIATKGAFVPEFEEAVYSLQEGELSQPIKTDFGYHLIQVTNIESKTPPSFADLEVEITADLKEQNQQALYNEAIAKINSMAVDGFGIADIAEEVSLPTKRLDNFAKEGNTTSLNSPAIIKAAFDEFTIQDESVSLGIDVTDKTVWVQPSNYRPVRPQSLDEARPVIKQQLTKAAAIELATKAAQAAATKLKSVETAEDITTAVDIEMIPLANLTRMNPYLTDAERTVVFSLDNPDNLTAIAVTTDGGASVLVSSPKREDAEQVLGEQQRQQTIKMLQEIQGQAYLEDYLNYLKTQYDIETNDDLIQQTAAGQ